ncbi:unnamed protein product [Chironomus riparius]|uniref:Serine-rich adhesin for platelets n=1 Tax=Chironomus riparius TaxID=315576 RepID=A0A9P0NGF3_9DIPT|nr:unnamed protein product [Chironomus riparius]
MSSIAVTQCPRFIQNAWKKDLCSNCFKSKEEHAAILQTIKSIPTTPKRVLNAPSKGIIKTILPSSKKHKKKSVNFPSEVSKVIGEGGEWLDGGNSDDDGDDFPDKSGEELVYDDDEELQKLTKTNTEFNMNNGNLLGDPTVNIKRSFAALKLGAPQKDATGKKQTLKISVTPFSGNSSSTSMSSLKLDIKSKLPSNDSSHSSDKKSDKSKNNGIILKSITHTSDDSFSTTKHKVIASETLNNDEVDKSPTDFDVKLASGNEKSLLEEINETLLSKKILVNEANAAQSKVVEETTKNDVIKVEIKNHDSITSAVISSSDSITNITCSANNLLNSKRAIMRNNAILKDKEKPKIQVCTNSKNSESESDLEFGTTSDYYDVVEARNSYENIGDGSSTKNETIDVSITQNKTEMEQTSTDNFVNNNKSSFFTNQVISDMFVSSQNSHSESIKKCAESYDLMESSFVSSKLTCDGLIVTKNHLEDALDSTGSSFDSSSDEELSNGRSESDSGIGIKGTSQLSKDINNSNNSSDYEDIQVTNEINKALANNRELPDGRSDPDGSSETSPAPGSLKNSQQSIDPRTSFLHSTANKPKVPIKPVIISKERSLSNDSLDTKATKKSRAPEPPLNNESEMMKTFKEESFADEEPLKCFKEFSHSKSKFSIKTNTVQIKEPRNYPAINPKFRSLNHLNKAHEAQEKLDKFEKLQSPTSPEPAPRHSLSFSSDSLADLEKGKKKKFSIKKFLRMGNSKTEHTPKKDYSHYADIPTSPSDDAFNAPQVKPRLIIIHPLDINNCGVEVVSTPTSSSQPSTPTIALSEKNQSVSSHKKPPMPPNRSDSTKLEMNKPTRPPPPKNNELRIKLESENVEPQKTTKISSNDTVYANLGEIRNSIAPRKPERTNSMREREAKTLELQRKQPGINGNAEMDDLKGVNNKSDDDHTETYKNEDSIIAKPVLKPSSTTIVNGDCKKKLPEIENVSTRSKIELFENNALKNDTKPSININKSSSPNVTKQQTTFFVNSDGLKSSVQKMNMTIDSYLKNKKLSSSDSNLLDNSRSPTPPQQQIIANVSSPLPLINYNNNRNMGLRNNASNYEPINVNVSAKLNYHRSSYPDNGMCSPTLTFGNATRSYCGSEIGESEIYSPYSFCGSDAACLDVSQSDLTDGCQGSSRNKIVNRLRLRKGRSVVHTNLEDNYSAVIIANHEALAQVLDQLQQPQSIPSSMRPIANCLNLRFDDFIILDSIGLVVGKRVFHQAVWQNSIYVTLVLTSDANQMVSGSELNQMSGGISGALNPITEFCDLVPNNYLPSMPTAKIQMVQATITVLPKMQVETLEMMGSVMKSKIQNNSLFGNLTGSDENVDTISMNEKSPTTTTSALDGTKSPSKSGLLDDLLCREVGFIVLQLVNGLKAMQAKGTEEMPMNLMNIIVCREMENKEQQARLCILQGTNSDLSRDEDEVMGTLCQCALKVIKELLPETKLTQLLSDLLVQERADTLTKIKSVLEYVLWGPSDVSINGPLRERELTLQRWLDLARATVLHGLVRTKIELTIYDECHLIFLVRSNSKIMLDASQIIATNFNNNSN